MTGCGNKDFCFVKKGPAQKCPTVIYCNGPNPTKSVQLWRKQKSRNEFIGKGVLALVTMIHNRTSKIARNLRSGVCGNKNLCFHQRTAKSILLPCCRNKIFCFLKKGLALKCPILAETNIFVSSKKGRPFFDPKVPALLCTILGT